ncbi:MAG: hypothetical protein QXH27_00995 [Candidatus Micrarchaeia archaeon]
MPEPAKPEAKPEAARPAAKSFLDLVKEVRGLERKALPPKPAVLAVAGELRFVDPSPPDIAGMSYWDALNEIAKINKVRALRLAEAVYGAGKPKPELAGPRLGAEGFKALQKSLKGTEDKGGNGASNAKK